MSLDGKVRERLTSFEHPYGISLLDESGRYLLLSLYTNYCQCDVPYEKLYSVYDLETKTLTPYPSKLSTNYMGPGTFIADWRGFFYAPPTGRTDLPTDVIVVNLDEKDYVHGANFSKDRAHLIMAVGAKEQEQDLDLLIANLKTGESQRFAKVLRGAVPHSQVVASRVPISFYDDGERVYVTMDLESEHEKRYAYTWKTNQVTAWESPVPVDTPGHFSSSSDAMYQLYPNGGLYKGNVLISENITDGIWVSGTHLIALQEENPSAPEDSRYDKKIVIFDADKQVAHAIATNLFFATELVGSSRDGKWLYLLSSADLTAAR
jgi:hypothetical protein